jgi:simple sugar transport system ATP-binding protein
MVGITKAFPGVVANDGIDLEVRRREIHGILGENGAGKTTLMNICYGLLQPDGGHIEFDGVPTPIRSPKDAVAHGIGMVHQHFMLVPNMTVAENVALGLRSERPPLSSLRAVAERVRELSRRHGLKVDPEDRVEDLSVGMQQRVEILKLLYRGAELLVLDEPTAVLTPPEWAELAQVLRSLVDEGKAAIFITHKLDEMLSVADRCTVLRDGAVVGTLEVRSATKPALARMMVGRDVVLRVERPPSNPGEPVLEVEDLSLVTARDRRILDGISFRIRGGEILGVAGVDGNGQHELVEVLTGLRPPTSGTIRMDGVPIPALDPSTFAGLGGAVIPEDRQHQALALDLSVEENLLMREIGREPFSHRGLLAPKAIRGRSWELIHRYHIRTPHPMVRIRQLSGGNQQRVVLARELHRRPRFLIAAQPTRGLDVGAMEDVYRQLLEHRAAGGATLLISAELDEILSLSDRVAVIHGGRFLRTMEAAEVETDALGMLMAGERVPG